MKKLHEWYKGLDVSLLMICYALIGITIGFGIKLDRAYAELNKYLGIIEIYTCENIYYIDKRIVWDENGLVRHKFGSISDLNIWLVERMTNELENNCCETDQTKQKP